MMMRRGSVVALLLGAALSGSTAVLAREPYPSRPARLIAPIAPGGAVDAMARSLAQELAARFGQPVVVDNRPGAGGSLGAELTARATRRIATEGSRAVGNTSAEFSANIRGEIGKWRKLVAQIRIKPE